MFICGSILSVTDTQLIYLSLGSNLGDRAANLERAIAAISGRRRASPSSSLFLYETEPVDFLDAAVVFELRRGGRNLACAARSCLHALQGIERNLGSKKLISRGPRLIDLDILFYGDEVIHESGMEIPHPRHGGSPVCAGAARRTCA